MKDDTLNEREVLPKESKFKPEGKDMLLAVPLLEPIKWNYWNFTIIQICFFFFP